MHRQRVRVGHADDLDGRQPLGLGVSVGQDGALLQVAARRMHAVDDELASTVDPVLAVQSLAETLVRHRQSDSHVDGHGLEETVLDHVEQSIDRSLLPAGDVVCGHADQAGGLLDDHEGSCGVEVAGRRATARGGLGQNGHANSSVRGQLWPG